MSTYKLLDAIGMVGDDLIAEARQQKPVFPLRRIVATAACLVLIIGIFSLLLQITGPGTTAQRIPITTLLEDNTLNQGFTGNWKNMCVDDPGMYLLIGISVTAKAVEVLPDTYQFYDDPLCHGWCLAKMEVLKVLHGKNVPKYFYFIFPEAYMTDLTRYDALVIKDLAQLTYENPVLYNADTGNAETFPCMLFSAYSLSQTPNLTHLFIAACSNGIFDESLWTASPAWEECFRYYRANLDQPERGDFVQRGWTLNQMEDAIRQEYAMDYHAPKVVSLSSSLSPAVAEALEYITPFTNGIFASTTSKLGQLGLNPEIQAIYRRYLNNYPTNQTVRLLGEKAVYSNAVFSDADISDLPDLASALYAIRQAYDIGRITPPHIADWQEREFLDCSIFGWYAKTSTGVYGIIRIDWKYKGDENLRPKFDDSYFIIKPGKGYAENINRDALLDLLDQGQDFVYQGTYDSGGKADVWGLIPPPV